ncbi:MAG: SDR family oxidoreductase [Bacteroidota bacterium]
MEFVFNEKIVLITGASRGIGRATALLFAQSGATVVVHCRREAAAALEVVRSLPGQGHSHILADLANPDELRKMVSEIIRVYGRIDILVNNAGIFREQDMTGIPVEDFLDNWEQTIRVNLTGPAILSNLVAREMIRSGGGRVVNVTSRGAFRGEPAAWAYGASKAGLNSVGQSMAVALAKHKIYVFTIAPGFVETEMSGPSMAGEYRKVIESQSPLNRVAQPSEIGRAILMLAADGMEYMTGCILDMNGASYLRS